MKVKYKIKLIWSIIKGTYQEPKFEPKIIYPECITIRSRFEFQYHELLRFRTKQEIMNRSINDLICCDDLKSCITTEVCQLDNGNIVTVSELLIYKKP